MVAGARSAASDKLTADFGTWKTPWGDINRFQRITDDIVHPFNDAGPSIPVDVHVGDVGLTRVVRRARLSEHEEEVRHERQQLRRGRRVRRTACARSAVTAGGESGDPKSKHFNDQAERYATGNLRAVYFYPNQLDGPHRADVPSGQLDARKQNGQSGPAQCAGPLCFLRSDHPSDLRVQISDS